MDYLLDTNIVLVYTRGSAYAQKIEDDLHIFGLKNNVAILITTDQDFNHLDEKYVQLKQVDWSKYKV